MQILQCKYNNTLEPIQYNGGEGEGLKRVKNVTNPPVHHKVSLRADN